MARPVSARPVSTNTRARSLVDLDVGGKEAVELRAVDLGEIEQGVIGPPVALVDGGEYESYNYGARRHGVAGRSSSMTRTC